MRSFLKRLFLFFMIFGLFLMVTGCGGKKGGSGGGGGGGGTKDAEIKQAITTRINSFKTAVEAYDADGMLAFLEQETNMDKKLTIVEGSDGINKYDKDYTTLESELNQDKDKQRHWRKSPEEGGNGYTLTMKLDAITFSKMKESGAYATVPFTIIEAAEDPFIEPVITDQGHMVCEMVKLRGTWYCQKLTINFYASDPSSSGGINSMPSDSTQSPSGREGSMQSAVQNVKYRFKNSNEKVRGLSVGSYAFE
jgi:hypothetical protein